MPFVDPSVQPVPHRLASKARPSDHPTTIGCTDAYSIGSSGATNQQNSRRGGPSGLATPIFSFYLSSLEPKSLRMVILTIILVQVLCCYSITKITQNGINGAMFVSVAYGS